MARFLRNLADDRFDRVLRVAGLAASFLVLAAATGAQEPSPDVAAVAIPAAEVAERADGLSRRLRQSRARLAPTNEIEAVASGLEERTRAITAEREKTLETLAGRPTLPRLAELERSWQRHEGVLEGWRSALTQRAAALEAEVSTLAAAEDVWVATSKSAAKSGAPEEVSEVIRRSIADIRSARADASARLGAVLSLQNRVGQSELDVSGLLASVGDARAALRLQLFEPDQPPIWSAVSAGKGGARQSIVSEWEDGREAVETFLGERRNRLVTLGVIFALACLGAWGLRLSVEARRAAGGTIAETSKVFGRPWTLAVLVTLLSVFWLFPLAPEALFDAVGLLLLLPILRLLPGLVHPGFRPVLYGIAVFYVIDRLRGPFEGAALEARVVLAVECAAAAVFCVALLRPSRMAKIPHPEEFPRGLGRAVRIAGAIFAAAFLANALGYVSLSRLAGDGLLNSIYIAVGLYAAVRVFVIILDVTTKTGWAQRLHFLRARRAIAVAWLRRGAALSALALWAYWSLGAFAIREPVGRAVEAVLAATLTVGNVSISLGDVIVFALTIAIAIGLSRLVRFVLMEDVFSRVSTRRGIPYAVSATAYYVILFVGFLLALAAAGIDFSKFALVAGAFGVGIGFGLQNVVNNFVSGIILLYERPIQVGDVIDMDDLRGEVKRIGIRSSTVRTFDGSEVIVPNADLISQRVINWTLSDKTRRIDVPIGVKYGTDPERVMEILTEIAEVHDDVLKHPPPVALFRGHGDSSLDFELRIWIQNFEEWFRVESEVNTAINRALKKANIEIPFPQRDLHLRTVDEDAARRLDQGGDTT